LRERFREIADFYRRREVSQVLVACHAASSALDPLSGVEDFEGVVFRGIIPASLRVAQRSQGRRLGVIGGNFTIESKVYERTLAGLGKHLEFCGAQPLSAFVEAGELNSEAVESEVRRLISKLQPIDSLLLACTHYPALAPMFRKVAPDLELLDPGADMVAAVQEQGSSYFEFFTTGDRSRSARAARLAFEIEIE
jgi:glutamate racemase